MKRVLAAGAAAALLMIALLGALHLPSVRAAILRRAVQELQARFDLTLTASRLDYNLAALRVSLADVQVAATHAAAAPFFAADQVSVTIPASTLFRPLRFRDVQIVGGRIHVHTRADGTSNLPPARTAAGEPDALAVDRLSAPGLSITYQDDSVPTRVVLPDVSVVLDARDGRIAIGRPGRVDVGAHGTDVRRLGVVARFDGRTLHFADGVLTTTEAEAAFTGRVDVLRATPELNLAIEGTGDIAALARWGLADDLPSGTVRFTASVAGPRAAPSVDITGSSPAVRWTTMTLTEAAFTARVTSTRLDVPRLAFSIAGGNVRSTINFAFGTPGASSLDAEWQGVALGALVPALADTVRSDLSGRVRLQGGLSDLTALKGEGDVGFARTGPAGAGGQRRAWPLVGHTRIRLGAGLWAVDGRIAAGPAPLALKLHGTLDAHDLLRSTLRGSVRSAAAALPPILRQAGIDAPVAGGTVQGVARFAGTVGDPIIDWTAQVRDTSVAGQPVATADAKGDLAGDILRIHEATAVQATPSGAFTGDAPGRLELSATYHVPRERYAARMALRNWLLAPSSDVPLSGRLNADLAGEGHVDSPSFAGVFSASNVRYAERDIGAVEGRATLQEHLVVIDGTIPRYDAEVSSRIATRAPYRAAVTVTASGLDVAAVAEDPRVTGTAAFRLEAEGPLDALSQFEGSLVVGSLDAKVGELRVRLNEPARATISRGTFRLDSLLARAGNTQIAGYGELPLERGTDAPDGALVATVTGDLGEALAALRASGLVQLPEVAGEGPVAVLARVTGAAAAPVVAADVELGPGRVTLGALPALTGITMRAHAEGDWLDLREARASFEGAQFEANGRVPLALLGVPGATRAGDARLDATLRHATAAVIAPFVDAATAEGLEGLVDATLSVTSPSLDLSNVRGELRLDRMELRMAGLPVTQREPTRIVAEGGFARVSSWQWEGQGASVEMRGQVRLTDYQAALLASSDVDLRMLTAFVRDAGVATAGRLVQRLSITGPITSPRVDGDARVLDGEIRLADPRVLVSELQARAALTRTGAQITSISGSVNGGALKGSGEVINAGNVTSIVLNGTVAGMALEFPEGLRSEMNADVRFALADVTADAPAGTLTGIVTVLRGAYREPLAVVGGMIAAVRARRVAAGAVERTLLDGIAMDLRVVTDEDVVVDNNYGRLQLGADVRVIGTAAVPALAGRAQLREGGQLFVGRNIYTIESGTIDFSNPLAIEPELNIEATTRAGGEEITLTLEGTPENLVSELRSPTAPELGQADLASLLLTGRTLDDVSGAEGEIVREQLLGYVSGDVLGFASRAVGLDSIRLGGVEGTDLRRDPTAIASETDPTARLTFGKSLGPNVDVTYSQSIRDGDAQTWIVDYAPRRQVELRLVSGDDDLRSYEFRHDVSFGAGAARAAVGPRSPQPDVVRVSVAGADPFREQLLDALRLEEGDRFDFVEWQRDRDRLERLLHDAGRLEARVRAIRVDTPGGVALDYSITAGPEARIEIVGATLDDAARQRMRLAWSQLAFDDFLKQDAEAIARTALARDGYLQAVVESAITLAGDIKTLTLTIARGERTTRRTVEIDADEQVRTEAETWARENGGLDLAWTDAARFERELTGHLRRTGRPAATVSVGVPAFNRGIASLPVAINTGRTFRVGQVRVEDAGAIEVPPEAALPVQGDLFSAEMLDAARLRLVSILRRRGFTTASVDAATRVDEEAQTVDVTLRVATGPRQVVGDVVIEGNRSIDDDVILRALALTRGEAAGAEAWLLARKRLFETGLFRRVDVIPEVPAPDPDASSPDLKVRPTGPDASSPDLKVRPAGSGSATTGAHTQVVNARVTVQEWPALRLRYGFQLAEERPEGQVDGRDLVPGLSADLTRRTLFGRAVSLGTALQYQRRERMGRVFLNAPTLLRLPVESSLTLERTRQEFTSTSLITDRSAASWEQRLRLVPTLRLSYSYRFERNHTFDTEASADPLFPAFDITLNVARLNGAAAWDTRDDPADTTRGWLGSASVDYAPEALGSDIRFVRFLGQAYYFRPVRGVVFASAARVGAATALGGQELIPSERFFAGGGRTVRGAAEDSLGPRDFVGDAAGGPGLLVLNQELRFPIYRWLRGVAFLDAGNVFDSVNRIRLGDLMGSYGFGARVETPFALLRVDYGRLFSPGPQDRPGRWVFGIGQSF